ncbi:calcium-binding protein [Ectocarpus siliculosus]|uniref:Calcium-binding protein n=1 Tax=Ectocarpus siliculosus TaxID=2880 RepID=D7FQ54_ECTSI|nr:calcium-binding protein [Ectocarpus siliculosus]|eukprot:CBJ48386.1 calcium-binding protein [Ectocarpus siliculosus]
MGNDMGRSANRMAIGAMANATHFEKKELLRLQRKFVELAQREGNPYTITRAEFREALELVGIMESDTEILDRLFSMFDKTGNDQINYKEFVGGLAPLCHGTVEEKLACVVDWCGGDGVSTIYLL